MKRQEEQASDSMALAALLTLAGGFQDAYSYNVRDYVFANAQTGNIVLLGQHLAQRDFQTALRYLLPLSAFVGGVYLAERMRRTEQKKQRLHWRQTVLLIEIALLLLVGCFPAETVWNIAGNVLLSFACAMQVNAFRKFQGMQSATTMCIGNLRSAAEYLCRYHLTKDPEMKKRARHYCRIILIFAAGAAAGAVLSVRIGAAAIWIPAALLFAGFLLMFRR